jgi:hypothetical protein
MITHFINWIKGFLSKKEEVNEAVKIIEKVKEATVESVGHCSGHTRYRVHCEACNAAIR